MMRFVLSVAMAGGLGLAAAADKATAQALNTGPNTNPYLQPAVSPYVNMNRPGNQATNYYGLVKPQLNTTKQLQSLQTQLQQQQLMPQLGVANADDDVVMANYAVTGHPTAFSNVSHYFGQPGGLVRPVQPPATMIKH
jgi:hypothetical protein